MPNTKHTPIWRRFWSHVEKSDGCWLWTGKKNENGYGRYTVGPQDWYAHRISYELSNGAIPDGMYVLHKCDTPACVRPDHLYVGTQADNMRDCHSRGRRIYTRKTHCIKGHEFTPDNVIWHKEGYRRCRECMNAPRRKANKQPKVA